MQTARIKVLLAGVCSLIVTLGIARFAYTPMLPVMQAQTNLTDSDAGTLAAINYIGYLIGVLITATTTSITRKDLYYRVGIISGLLSTLGMVLTDDFLVWAVMRTIQGISAASGLMIGTGLILHWLLHHKQNSNMGLHFTGMGLGIALTAIISELLPASLNWQLQWVSYTLIGFIFAIPALAWLPTANAQANHAIPPQTSTPSSSWLTLLTIAYGCAGVGYVIHATFTVAIMDRIPMLQEYGNLSWLLVGIVATPSVIIWEKIAKKHGELETLIGAFLLQITGILLPLISTSLTSLLLSATLYGATFIGIVAMVLIMIGKRYPNKPATVMGRLTLSFCIAQIVAPAITGVLAEQSGNFNAGLWMATIAMLLGIVMLAMMRRLNTLQIEPPNNAKASLPVVK